MTEVSKEKALYDALYKQGGWCYVRQFGEFIILDGDFELKDLVADYHSILEGRLTVNSDYKEPKK